MKSQYRAVNRYISKILSSSSIDWSSNSGTFQVEDTTVGWFSLPTWAVTFFVTADFAQTWKEEILRIVNVSWNILTYDKRISVGSYVKPSHAAWASIRINDVADIINEMSENIDNFGEINAIDWTATIRVWWGVFNNGWTVYNVASQIFSISGGQLVDNSTNYVHFDLTTRLFLITASSTLAWAVCMGSVVVTAWAIWAIWDIRPGLNTTYWEITTKLDKAGGLRDTIQSNTSNDGIYFAWKTKLPIVNADFSTGSWSQSSWGWIWDKSYGWNCDSVVGSGTISYDTGRLKIALLTTGSRVDGKTTSGGYYTVTPESLPIEPNTTYTVEYDMETLYTSWDATGWASVKVFISDSAGGSVTEIAGTTIKTTTGITHYSFTVNSWATGRYLNINPRVSGNTGTSTLIMTAWFDNFVISCPSVEIVKPVVPSSVITAYDKLLLEKQDGTLSKAKVSDFQSAIGITVNIPNYESTIVLWDAVWLFDDGIFECTTENKSSANITASSITVNLGQAQLDTTRTVFYYAVGLNTYARVWTLTWDVMTYWTEVNIGNGSSGSMTGSVSTINTDKVVFMYMDWSTASTMTMYIGTITGTSIALWAPLSLASSGNTRVVRSSCKVRNDCFVVSVYPTPSTNGVWFLQFYTVSGTTISAGTQVVAGWTWEYKYGTVIYLMDNRIGTVNQFTNGSVSNIPHIIDITPGTTTIATTYIGANAWTGAESFLSRYADDSYILTLTAINTNTILVPKPPSGTTITTVNLFDNWAGKFLPSIPAGNQKFILIDWTTWSLYQEKTLIGSLTMSLTAPTFGWVWTQLQGISLYNGRIRFISGTNGTARIINFATSAYFGIANSTTGDVLFRWTVTITGIERGYLYYIQTDWTLGKFKTSKYVGRGIATNLLLIW